MNGRHRSDRNRNTGRSAEWLDRSDGANGSGAIIEILAEHGQLAIAHQSERIRHKFTRPRCWQPLDGFALTLRIDEVRDRLLDEADVPMVVLNPRPHTAAHQV